MKSAMVPVRFDPETVAAVKFLACQEGRTVSDWIRRAVDRGVLACAERPRDLIEGSGRLGAPRAFPSSPARTRRFRCRHIDASGVGLLDLTCPWCGPVSEAA